MDRLKARRKTNSINPSADMVVISQALAKEQLRLSGVSFFTADGRLGNTGRNLERFLNRFKRTVYPPRPTRLTAGITIPQCRRGYVSVYATELVQCYPGKTVRGRGDRRPSPVEVETCMGRGFLARELSVVKPRVILLMGDKARRAFYSHFMGQQLAMPLGQHLGIIVRSKKVPSIRIRDVEASVLPIQHASGANPAFWRMLERTELVELIREALERT